ncbi:hypothetical protein H112_00424 [Trichophyton rubrum D6]|uniref:Uncharacterized protein n=4 Tax=Trichophyton TaxID=5550 RepID=A0A178FA50_TRIRU|nr:uncharacterized protein TERG_08042 [Trichophyton rubrum CBS 118892]EZF27583.1 hypothetical protein H100_00423 [Trichophyton rubrum MR850]EZF46617.1 hypothetical protein H102_00422 [Trichophyton rubrum CBS 100081]EZF57280.1 hypothetical protein H103_00422 [Trichophyton rubrum CBS 288.86]EZF67877.1 hypothetical protein H104_00412 [Trichophyton rubrum CBS 289.86]EZF78495.1 hypothetical protein H105_00411 [Trichophyton soudanense CBS 452.61]EZF89132.1 hypothetical protein H110_00426 [Trichophy
MAQMEIDRGRRRDEGESEDEVEVESAGVVDVSHLIQEKGRKLPSATARRLFGLQLYFDFIETTTSSSPEDDNAKGCSSKRLQTPPSRPSASEI